MGAASNLPLYVGVGVGAALLVGMSRAALASSGNLPGDAEGLRKRAKVNPKAAAALVPYVSKWAKVFQYPASLHMALMSIESGYDPNNLPPPGASDWANGRGGAWGLSQMLLVTAQGLTKNAPNTAKQYWPTWDGTGKGLQDPQVSLAITGYALGKLWAHYRSNPNAWMLTGLSWNRGQAGVDRLLNASNIPGPGAHYYNALAAQRQSNPNVIALVDSEKKGGYAFA